MEKKHLNEVSVGSLNNEEIKEIQQLEQKLRDKYYLIAFSK